MTSIEMSNLLRIFHKPVRFAVELLEHSNVADNVVMGESPSLNGCLPIGNNLVNSL
jgi:hypothetical protein